MENKKQSLTKEDKNLIMGLIKGIQYKRYMKLTSIGVQHDQKSITEENYLYVADLEISVLENILNKIDLYVENLGDSIRVLTFDELWKFEYMQLKDIIKDEINKRNIMDVLEPEYKAISGSFKAISGSLIDGQIIEITHDSGTFIDPFQLEEPIKITKEDIINKVENIITLRSLLKPLNLDTPKDVLEAICLENNLELSDTEKDEILKFIQNNK